ncbi:MAG: DinB family protein [Saprospiraceae bacterium]
MNIEDFNKAMDYWIASLDQYTFDQLVIKPSPETWSVGQMFIHLIDDTTFFIDQIKICTSTNDHSDEVAIQFAAGMLRNNEFPDEIIQGSPDNVFIPQPENKEQLLRDLMCIKEDMNVVVTLMEDCPFEGKSKHPGLGYFNAIEWLQFAEMHLRHHRRQKSRLDQFIFLHS